MPCRLLWQQDAAARAFDWLIFDERLIFSTIGGAESIWSVSESEFTPWGLPLGGHLAAANGQLWLYAASGVYRLDPARRAAELVYALPQGLLRWGDMAALPGGGALVLHSDAFDRRLLALDASGALRWERSCAAVSSSYQQDLLLVNGRPYLATQNISSWSSELSILALDLETTQLTQIFEAGSRNALPGDIWTFASGGERLLINVGGTGMLALDAQAALAIILPGGAP